MVINYIDNKCSKSYLNISSTCYPNNANAFYPSAITTTDPVTNIDISINKNEPLASFIPSQSKIKIQPQQQIPNDSHFNTEKDTINICQTCKKDNPYINMSIKNPLLDQNMENNSFPPEAYTILTTQIRELSQENKEKDNKIEKLYRQLQMEQKNSKILKDKICKIKKEINKINERNQRNFQLYVLKSDEHLYNTEKGYLKRIRELELELYKERLQNKSLNKTSTNQIKRLNEELESTTQKYQNDNKNLNIKQNAQLDALYKEFVQLKKKMYIERQERKDINLDLIFKILNEKNNNANDTIDKLMKKIKS